MVQDLMVKKTERICYEEPKMWTEIKNFMDQEPLIKLTLKVLQYFSISISIDNMVIPEEKKTSRKYIGFTVKGGDSAAPWVGPAWAGSQASWAAWRRCRGSGTVLCCWQLWNHRHDSLRALTPTLPGLLIACRNEAQLWRHRMPIASRLIEKYYQHGKTTIARRKP